MFRKPVAVVSLLAILIALFLPVFWQAQESPKAADSPPQSGTADREIPLTVKTGELLTQTNMGDYLPGVLAGEMPALFETEALKAQAVAARTYILYRAAHPSESHPDADICDDPACCKAWSSDTELQELWGTQYASYRERMEDAVRSTDGQYLRYDGQPIQAVFHSSSPGQTQASREIWNDCPYLQSVSSPETAEDVPNFISQVEVSAEEFRSQIRTLHPSLVFADDPASWVEETAENSSGRADHTTVCGTEISGTEMRTLFSLRSAAYTLEYTDRGSFLFTVTGYGHGVGMSQYGANVFAQQGMSYDAILAHYYPGTELASP